MILSPPNLDSSHKSSSSLFSFQDKVEQAIARSISDLGKKSKLRDACEFALTGAVYSRSPKHLEQARQGFRVGNLYLNRGSTGAMVHRQPFGGFKMSGAGTKAGGPGYLLNFVDPRCVTENTLRRGFTPDLE